MQREFEHIGSYDQAMEWFLHQEPTSPAWLAGTTIRYRGTIKLHGSNCAVIVGPDGLITTQSRTRTITPEDDFKGFARWISDKERSAFFRGRAEDIRQTVRCSQHSNYVIFYGEWVGPGVMPGSALSQLTERCFVVFATWAGNETHGLTLYHPFKGSALIHAQKNAAHERNVVCALGIFCTLGYSSKMLRGQTVTVYDEFVTVTDPTSRAALDARSKELTAQVELECPLTKILGVAGAVGEGIVWEPIGDHFGIPELRFKTKGKAHAVVGPKPEKTVSAELTDKINAFMSYACTQQRLEQGLEALSERSIKVDIRAMGEYLKWFSLDVQRECGDQLAEMSVDWKEVQPAVQNFARNFFKEHLTKL